MICNVLRWYVVATISWTQEQLAELRRDLFGLSFRCWAYIWEKLKDLVDEVKTRNDNDGKEAADAALQVWVDFGTFVGLREDNGPTLYNLKRDHLHHFIDTGPHPLPNSNGCCWTPCVCAGGKPPHKLRTCTGCNTYVYCGEQCQRLYVNAISRHHTATDAFAGLLPGIGSKEVIEMSAQARGDSRIAK